MRCERVSVAAYAKGLMMLARLPMQRTHSYVASEALRRAATLQRCVLGLRSAPAGLIAWWREEQRLQSSTAASRACWSFSCAASEVLRCAAMLRALRALLGAVRARTSSPTAWRREVRAGVDGGEQRGLGVCRRTLSLSRQRC